MRAAKTDDDLSRAQYADMKTYLPGDILTKVDRTSMAVSLEVRAPIIDHEFMEWAAGIPAAMRLKGGEGKYIFKKALEPYLPHDVMYRDKMGFAVPISEWFRGPLRQRVGDVAPERGSGGYRHVRHGLSGKAGRSAPVRHGRAFARALGAADVRNPRCGSCSANADAVPQRRAASA